MERADPGYVRRHRERWDITAVLEPLQLLGSKTTEVNVHLYRSPPGRLAVTIQFQLEPASAPPMGATSGQVIEVPLAGTTGTDFEAGATSSAVTSLLAG